MPTVGRFKDTDFIIKGEVEERLPRITDGLVMHFPFDGSIQDRLTEAHVDVLMTTVRDWHGPFFPEHYNFANMKLIITGEVMCEEAADWTKTTCVGITNYTAQVDEPSPDWRKVKTWTLSQIRNKWESFAIQYTVPATFIRKVRPWLQIDISGNPPGYKVHYKNVNYLLVEDPKYITNENTDLTQEYLSIRESSQNYIQNGNFKEGLKNWAVSANATTYEWIYTPYGHGVRVNRNDGDDGNWPLYYTGPRDWTYNAKETWVWSFKFRVNRGNPKNANYPYPFYVGWWINDKGSWQTAIPIKTIPLVEDGWYQGYASYTFEGSFSALVASGINSNGDYSSVDFADIRLEKRNFPTATPDNGTSGDGKFGLNVILPNAFSLSAERRFVTDTTWTRLGIVKDGSDNLLTPAQCKLSTLTGYNPDAFTNWVETDYSSEFDLATGSGWESKVITATGLTVGKEYTFSTLFENPQDYELYTGTGIEIQVLSVNPTNSSTQNTNVLFTKALPNVAGNHQSTITFTASASTMYIKFNFGFVQDGLNYHFKFSGMSLELNGFYFYKNGLPTTEFVNMWTKIKVKGVGYGKNVGYDITKYTDPIEKTYEPDSPSDSMKLNIDDCGFYYKTFVYCSQDISVKHHYYADNYGGMRINNGPLIWIGGWENGTTTINPDVTLDLVKGWNLVELVWMDGDSGGSFTLRTGTKLSLVPEVLYMTAELPVEMSNNKPYFNEKSNVDIRNMSIYNRALTDKEFISVHGTKGISIDSGGNAKMIIKEALPYLPEDAVYFPLGSNAEDINGIYSPVEETNVVYEDGWAWVGKGVSNLVVNGDGKSVTPAYSVAGSYKPGWDAALHPFAIGVNNWSGGYNPGVNAPTIGYHAQWVYEGLNGPTDPCIKFVNRNDLYANDYRWLGINQGMGQSPNTLGWTAGKALTFSWKKRGIYTGSEMQIGLYHKKQVTGNWSFNGTLAQRGVKEPNVWEKETFKFTVPSDMDLATNCTVYLYGNYGTRGITWVDDIMLHDRPFAVPFTPSSRGDSALEFNLNDSIGLNWNGDWSIVYFKIPVGTHVNTLNGYNIESIGCNGNTVGGSYIWWGKADNTNSIYNSTPSAIDPTTYFDKPRMVSLVKKGTLVTIKEWDYLGNVFTRTQNLSASLPTNAFVTQYGYDLKLGGYDNGSAPNSYYRDLVVAKRAFTDEEVERFFKTRASSREDGFYISGRVLVDSTLS